MIVAEVVVSVGWKKNNQYEVVVVKEKLSTKKVDVFYLAPKKKTSEMNDVEVCLGNDVSLIRVTPMKTNMSPKNQWLEDDSFPFEMVPFLGTC